jgi:hypothetical protein
MDKTVVFSAEADMTKPATAWLEKQGLFVKSEYSSPWGICDLVGVLPDKEKVKRRLELGQKRPVGPPWRLQLLHMIPDEVDETAITLGRLQKSLGPAVSKDRLAFDIHYLIQNRFIHETRCQTYQKRNGWMPLCERTVAIELKLCRVDDVLHQAISNLKFAPESYVGLPVSVAHRVASGKRRDDFQHTGIGLLAVERTRCRPVIEPKPCTEGAERFLQDHCAERFWLSHIIDSL